MVSERSASQPPATTPTEIFYPESDGQPMADNTKQFRWIVVIKENLELLFADRPDVFVAGDLLWYPVEGNNTTRQAPDAMVIFGRPKGDRGSYQQWQDVYDPDDIELIGWLRQDGELEAIEIIENWVSPELGIRFDLSGEELQIFRPDGQPFLTYVELAQRLEQAQQDLNQAQQNLNQTQQALEEERQRSQVLADRLREMGIDPDQL